MFENLIVFLKKPHYIHSNNNSLFYNIKSLFICFFFGYLCVFVCSFIAKFLLFLIDFDPVSYIFQKQEETLFKDSSVWNNALYILFLAPIIEEIIFRLSLNLKKINILISGSIAILILVGEKILKINLTNIQDYYFKFGTLVLFLAFVYIVKQSWFDNIRDKYFSFYFYLVTILFALLHIGNFNSSIPSHLFWAIPLLILPQFIMGMFFGYMRLKSGVIWAIALHILMNTPAVLIYLSKQFLLN